MKNKNKLTRFFATLRMTSKRAAFTLAEVPEARQYAPSPLEGEGWGEGFKKRAAFTLAEVLITLGIIGIVAAMTIPTLIQKHEEKSNLVKLLKIYSTMSQAYLSIIAEHGTPDQWSDYPQASNTRAQAELASAYWAEKFRPHLKIIKDCGYNEGCFPNVTYKLFNGQNSINFITNKFKRYMLQLSDGSVIAFLGLSPNVEGYGGFYIDLNGAKEPNTFGKDVFEFHMHNNYIKPGGMEYNDFMKRCYNTGFECAYWVVTRKNFNYLHCNDLVPGVKETCD